MDQLRALTIFAAVVDKGSFKEDGKQLLDDYISREELWACTSCNACVEACPVEAIEMTGAYELANYEREDFEFTKQRLLK